MKKFVVLIMAVAIGLFACKKDEKEVTRVANMPLAIGNYWVYQVFNVDTDDVATPTNDYDTCRITGTQFINGSTYFNFENYPIFQNNENLLHLRDCMGYLVDQANNVYYAETDYETVFDTATFTNPDYTISSKMDWKNAAHTVPLGTYSQTGAMVVTTNITQPSYPWPTQRIASTVFAKDVGIIKRRYFFFNAPNYVELRLVDFHLEQ